MDHFVAALRVRLQEGRHLEQDRRHCRMAGHETVIASCELQLGFERWWEDDEGLEQRRGLF